MLVVITFSVIHPLQLVLVPLALLLLALPPRSPREVLVAALLIGLVFAGPRGTLWYVERGWALLVGGWFVVAVAAWPAGRFTARGVAAIAGAMATAAAIIFVRGGWTVLDETIAAQYREVAAAVARTWPGQAAQTDGMVALVAEVPVRVFPGLIAIGSLAGLAIAWWAYARFAGRDRSLGRLREFRFPDVLVWVLIGGLALLIAPVGDWAPRLGLNLVVFMGALYALRGLAVMATLVLAMAGSRVVVLVVVGVVALLLYPIVVAGTLLLGVTDTWLDLRSGRQAVNEEG
jgi:hypothetical protein